MRSSANGWPARLKVSSDTSEREYKGSQDGRSVIEELAGADADVVLETDDWVL